MSQIDRADIRLAYVQHPFPAQGRTTDTTHVILGEHTTQEGSYVALTRARRRTDIYASHDQLERDPLERERDQIETLVEWMGRTEPDLPSIRTPLAHEHAITANQGDTIALEAAESQIDRSSTTPTREPAWHAVAALGPKPSEWDPDRTVWDQAAAAIDGYRARYEINDTAALGREPPVGAFEQRHARREAAMQALRALERLGRPVHRDGTVEERILNTPGRLRLPRGRASTHDRVGAMSTQ